jgi:hypothetical protein
LRFVTLLATNLPQTAAQIDLGGSGRRRGSRLTHKIVHEFAMLAESICFFVPPYLWHIRSDVLRFDPRP